MYRHILVALDGSAEAEQVLPHVEALAGQFDSDVLLISAVIPPERLFAVSVEPGTGLAADPEPLLEAEEAEEEDAVIYLKGVTARLEGKGIHATFEAPQADASTIIVERARERGIDLIAMTTHGRSGLGRLVWGSTAEAVLRHAPCPVLLVRVKETT
jgi:nucleotide-binding universal stress UspA family protein